MSDLRVNSAVTPTIITGGGSAWLAAWGTPDGAMHTDDRVQGLVAAGRVFTANAGTGTAPITFAGAFDADGPDLVVDVPSGTSIMPLFLSVHYEAVGTTALLETFASASGTLGATSSGTGITPRSMRVGGGGGASVCTVTGAVGAAGCTAQSGALVEFARSGYQLAEDMAATEDWASRTFNWAQGNDGPAPLLIGDGSIFVHAAAQAGTGFITLTWAEFQGNEY